MSAHLFVGSLVSASEDHIGVRRLLQWRGAQVPHFTSINSLKDEELTKWIDQTIRALRSHGVEEFRLFNGGESPSSTNSRIHTLALPEPIIKRIKAKLQSEFIVT